MSEYKAYTLSYKDSNGNFVALPTNDASIVADNHEGKLTISPSYDCCAVCKNYISTKEYIENMFDKIKDYKVYEKTTVVFFSDGTKETVICCDEDTFDVEQGIIMCVIKRMFGDKYKKSVKSIIKAKTLNEKNVKELEAAHKEAQLREERKEKRNRENKLRMKARYEARLAAAIEEEEKKLKENRKIKKYLLKG